MADLRLALLLPWDRTGLADLGRRLESAGFYVVSAGDCAAELRAVGVQVVTLEQLSGTPEILSGRVRLLHPAVLSGVLANRSNPADLNSLSDYRVAPVDVVALNLPPCGEPEAPGVPARALPALDAGAMAALVSAASNSGSVVVLCDPKDYRPTLDAMAAGSLAVSVRAQLAAKALNHVAEHLSASARQVVGRAADSLPPQGRPSAERPVPLQPMGRGGAEANAVPLATKLRAPADQEGLRIDLDAPRWLQRDADLDKGARIFRDVDGILTQQSQARLVQGPALRVAELVDADLAWSLVLDLGQELHAAAVVHHGTICGAALMRTSAAGAVLRAIDADPLGVQGAVLATNRRVDAATVRALTNRTLSMIVAPHFDDDALEVLSETPELRLLEMGTQAPGALRRQIRSTHLGVVLQDARDCRLPLDAPVVTAAQPSSAERSAAGLAWLVARHLRPCAVVLCDEQGTVGIAAGLPTQADSAVVAVGKSRRGYKARAAALNTVLSGRDVLDALGKVGVKALAVPWGNADEPAMGDELLTIADQLGMSVTTGAPLVGL